MDTRDISPTKRERAEALRTSDSSMDPEQLSRTTAETSEASSMVNPPRNLELSSPATDASPDPYDDPDYYSPKWPKAPPKEYKPYLTSFTLFSKLPIEIRRAIWKYTLTSRVVEIVYTMDRGFYSFVKIPVALKVNKDSRNAVGYLYPLCFGNLLHPPTIIFNFSMDVLYFDADLGPDVLQFVVSLNEDELKRIRYIAIDRDINEYLEYGGHSTTSYNSMVCLKKAIAAMPAIQETLMVFKLDEYWHEHGFPMGSGQIELMDSFSYELQQFMFHELYHLDDEDGESECQELPDSKHLLGGFDVSKKGSIWGWRPTELPLQPFPWDTDIAQE